MIGVCFNTDHYKRGEEGRVLEPSERTDWALRVESKTLRPLFYFLSPIRQRARGNQTGENNWLYFPHRAGMHDLGCWTWCPDACLSVVFSRGGLFRVRDQGTHTAQGVWTCVCVCSCMCVRGREEALRAAENAWWWVTKNRALGDNGTQDIPDITPTHRGGSGRGDLLVSTAPRPERRNGCLFCPLWRWRWTESRRLA